MCGFTGFWSPEGSESKETLLALGEKMAAKIGYRGPDDQGGWCDEKKGLVLSHRRLSIVDLSILGHQPMVSGSGKSVIAYNGEIYNGPALREELAALGRSFKSHTDTEVLLEACEAWGVQKAVSKCIGMFAFAFWDIQTQTLTLARDRLGIKPVYFGHQGDTFFFGSQPRSFMAHPAWRGDIDPHALGTYFRFNAIPAPASIYKGIHKLRPGRFLEVQKGRILREATYWDMHEIVEKSVQSRAQKATLSTASEAEHIEALEVLLRDAVGRRMVADVPLGAFLSGGIDSSLVVALMQSQSDRPIKTFSIGFEEKGFDEAPHARKVAAHLQTDHHELYVTSRQAQEVIPQLPSFYDEPFADISQIPTYLVSKIAREQVTVALSGDGGDELFGGYGRYFVGQKMWGILGRLPKGAPFLLSKLGRAFSPATWNKIGHFLPSSYFSHQLGDKIYKGLSFLEAPSAEKFYASLVSTWNCPWEKPWGIVPQAKEVPVSFFPNLPLSFIEKMQFADSIHYLPDDILTKVDRASMAVSLEARVPLIDHRVFEMAWQLPESVKVRAGQGKWILRQILKKYVPETLFERPKMGFGVPIGDWMRRDLRDLSEDLLSEHSLQESGLLESAPIRRLWTEHLSGQQNWQSPLWGIMMFQMWHRSIKKEAST